MVKRDSTYNHKDFGKTLLQWHVDLSEIHFINKVKNSPRINGREFLFISNLHKFHIGISLNMFHTFLYGGESVSFII